MAVTKLTRRYSSFELRVAESVLERRTSSGQDEVPAQGCLAKPRCRSLAEQARGHAPRS